MIGALERRQRVFQTLVDVSLQCPGAFPGSPDAPTNGPGYAEIARAYGAEGVRIRSADELLPALKAAIASGAPSVLDVPMINNPTPTTGHWNILDIYSPDKDVSHVST